MTSARGFTFAATMRVIDRVHRDTAIVRALSHPSLTTGFTERNIFVIAVAYCADSRHAIRRDTPYFTRREFQKGDLAFTRNQLGLSSR